jgi:iron complex transport system substrate-binding protein
MSSAGMSKTSKTVWTVLVVALIAVAAFTGGYFVGAMVADTDEGFTVVDDYGRAVTIEGVPERIISIAPSPTEILFAIGAGPQIVGVDNYSDYPEEALSLPKVGDYTLNLEAIASLQPDLIVGGDLVPLAQLEQLEAQGIPYVLLADRTLEDVLKTIRLAGVITGHVDEADAVADALSERIDAVTEKTLDPTVVEPRVYIEYDEFMGLWTYGPGSFGDDLIIAAGGVNIAHNTTSEYPMVESEFVIAQDPEIIIYTTGPWSTLSEDTYINRPGWDVVDAVIDGDIYGVDANLLSRYGPRIVDCLELLAEMIHPELFP